METALAMDRLHFAFTVTFHYLFPQLTMGLALLIVSLKTLACEPANEHYHRAARFWAKIFAINFAVGVVTGIPMEFQFGTNWARFSQVRRRRHRTDAGHGRRLFLLPRIQLSGPIYLTAKRCLGPVGHWLSAVLVWLGSWLSGFFIVATDAWMQHPTGYTLGPGGEFGLASFWDLLLNPWGQWQYPHNDAGGGGDRSFRDGFHRRFLSDLEAPRNLRTHLRATGVGGALFASCLLLFATGDGQGRTCLVSARDAGGDGRPVHNRAGRAARDPGPARHRAQTAR